MSDVTDYVSKGINAVFGFSPPDLTVANSYLSTYTSQTYLLISNLNGLCGCDFIAETKLQNIIPSQSVVNSIYSAFNTAGATLPTDILLRYQAGDSNIAIGTLGSFYSCVSSNDPAPVLVATGSYTFSGYQLASKQCNNWAMIGVTLTNGVYEVPSGNSPYFAVSSNGPCYQFEEFNFTPIGYGEGICMYALYNTLPS